MEEQSPGLGVLLNKLSHDNIDTRLRCTQNLIFKSKHNLITEITKNTTLTQQLFQGIIQSLELTFAELSTDETAPILKRKLKIQLHQLLDFVTQLCSIQSEAFNSSIVSDILRVLKSLVLTDNIDKVLRHHVQQVRNFISHSSLYLL